MKPKDPITTESLRVIDTVYFDLLEPRTRLEKCDLTWSDSATQRDFEAAVQHLDDAILRLWRIQSRGE